MPSKPVGSGFPDERPPSCHASRPRRSSAPFLLGDGESLGAECRRGRPTTRGNSFFPLFILSHRTLCARRASRNGPAIATTSTIINEKGGVDGVKIFVQECETAYTVERAFECYERYKNGYDGAPVAVLFTTSSGFDAAVSDKAAR